MFKPDVSPTSPIEEQPVIGLIGMGEMGQMYAKRLASAGWKKIYVCDRPERYENLKKTMEGMPSVKVLPDGHHVSRASDFILYSVEAEFIDRVVQQYGPSTKVGAIVGGQTSVKAPERTAFEKWLPEDVQIVSCHSLHGPTVDPRGQPLVLINHRGTKEALALVENLLRPFESRFVYMSYEEHDLVTANTQAVTHAAFLSMGTAWHSSLSYPWEHGLYVGGIETVKVNITLRIYSNKWHVYAGLAILNPSARVQIDQFAKSATELFKLMLAGDEETLRERVYKARNLVFGDTLENGAAAEDRRPILLSEQVLDQFSLGQPLSPGPANGDTFAIDHPPSPNLSTHPRGPRRKAASASGNRAIPNSHLSLLAMVDCWAALHIRPFTHLELAATPIFRMWIGVAEYLFRSEERLDAALKSALWDVTHRSDDIEFVVAARGWSNCISFGNFELYKDRFQSTSEFFKSRFAEADKVGSKMIKAILADVR